MVKIDFIESTNICLILSTLYTLILESRGVNLGQPGRGAAMLLGRPCTWTKAAFRQRE